MRTRSRFLYLAIAILSFLLLKNSGAEGAVQETGQAHLSYFPERGKKDNEHVIAAKTRLASDVCGISRRQQIPVSFSERHTGPADLPGLSLEWQVPLKSAALSLCYDAGRIFISRLRSLLYPKHSFW